MDWAVIGLSNLEDGGLRPWFFCGSSVAACILLRPDGGILLASIGVYLGIVLVRALRAGRPVMPAVRAGVVIAACLSGPTRSCGDCGTSIPSLARVSGPAYANEEDEFVPMGFNRWTKTWIAELGVYRRNYWNVPGDKIDPANLPARALDSEEQGRRHSPCWTNTTRIST